MTKAPGKSRHSRRPLVLPNDAEARARAVRKIKREALDMVERLRQKGWTQQDFANALREEIRRWE